MSSRIDDIRKKALKDYDSSQKDLSGPRNYYEAGAIFGATEALTYTDEDVERAARAMHLSASGINWEAAGKPAKQEFRKRAVAALESFGARRVE